MYPTPSWASDPNKVRYMQQFMNDNHGTKLSIDGKFGPNTQAAWNTNGAAYDAYHNWVNGSGLGSKVPITPAALPASTVQPQDATVGTFNSPAITNHATAIGSPVQGTPVPTADNKSGVSTWSKIGKGVDSIIPFASNIANSFRSAPTPAPPVLNNYTTIPKVNLEKQRYDIRRETGASNAFTEANVDNNTAEAIKLFNRGSEENQLSQVNDKENNLNLDVSKTQAMMDAQTSAGNNALTNEYHQSILEKNIANQREQSQNLANASDKYIEIQNQKKAAQVSQQRNLILKSLYDNSGVINRQAQLWKNAGLPDPYGVNYGYTRSKFGGSIPSRKLTA